MAKYLMETIYTWLTGTEKQSAEIEKTIESSIET